MKRTKRATFVVGCMCAAGMASCGSASESEPDGYVLLDLEARQAGLSVEVGEQAVTSALPIAVSAGAHVALVGPEQNKALEVGAGELVYVEGARANVTHLQIGKQIAAGELRLLGDDHAAGDLASQLGGSVESLQGELHLRAPEVFSAIAGAHVPEHLQGVAPVLLATPSAPAAAPHAAIVAPVAQVAVPAPPLVIAPSFAPEAVATPARVQTELPVTFAPAAECSGMAGTWRGRAYSSPHGAYYDFTMQVRERGTAVQGTVVAEFWSGSTDEVDPPQACSGAQHVKVFESGSGTVDANGTMHFASKTWRVNDHLCGPRVGAYSPDRFDVPSARSGGTSDAVLSDDAVWISGLPVKLTRVSCR